MEELYHYLHKKSMLSKKYLKNTKKVGAKRKMNIISHREVDLNIDFWGR